ncbi:MAG: glucose 1-dehydrogenase [Planctomycetaceae bacterium]
MRALAVHPGRPHSAHVADIPEPTLAEPGHRWVRNGHGVKVRTLQVGVDATDGEINEALYGLAPEGADELVLGHEVFGVVEEVGVSVKSVRPGDLVTCTVRRPGKSIYDQIGRNDITSDRTYYERGICLINGFLSAKFVDDEEYIVRVPRGLKEIGVLSEPASVCAKGIEQAYLAQRRLQVWEPKLAFVMGAGQIGQLTTMMLRLRGLEVYTLARGENPGLKQELIEAFGATYISTRHESVQQLAGRVGAPDLIFEATGNAQVAFDCMSALGLNGALVWTSVTGGEKLAEVPVNKINLDWVLGNKLLVGSVNGNRYHFERGLADLALGESMYPGVIRRLLTHRIDGIDDPAGIMRQLEDGTALKTYVSLSEIPD